MSIEAHIQVERGTFKLNARLELPASGVTAVFGPSGSGKTTLLRALAGLEPCPGSRVIVNGTPWQTTTESLATHERSIGLVFQEPSLFEHLTVQANLDFGRQRIPKPAQTIPLDHSIELLEISPLLNRYPHQLSVGEQQRVAIARALVVCPEWLLLDEPLAAMDVARKREILPYLETLCRESDLPILYVSHSREEVARLADHLVVLNEGKVIANGPAIEIFSNLDLPLASEPDSASIIETTVAGHDNTYGLTLLDFAGGQFQVTHHDLPVDTPVPLRVQANDVSLTLERPTQTSILNVFKAEVVEMAEAGPTHVLVKLAISSNSDSGPTLLARITRKSAEQLALQPGHAVYAQIKSAALLN